MIDRMGKLKTGFIALLFAFVLGLSAGPALAGDYSWGGDGGYTLGGDGYYDENGVWCTYDTHEVPEPATIITLAAGLLVAGLMRKKVSK